MLTIDLDDEDVAGELRVAGVGLEVEVAAETFGNLGEVAAVLEELLGPVSGRVESALVAVADGFARGLGGVVAVCKKLRSELTVWGDEVSATVSIDSYSASRRPWKPS